MEWTYQITRESETMMEAAVAVPPSWSYIEIAIDVVKEYALLFNFILIDPEGQVRMLRQLGNCDNRIVLTEDSRTTTPGGVPGAIMPGQWKMVLCLFSEYVEQLLGEHCLEIRVAMEGGLDRVALLPPADAIGEVDWNQHPIDDEKMYQMENRWYKGDFHTHTQLSDGKETVTSAMKKAVAMNMDFYIPTEHNVIHTGWSKCPIMIVPGIEITTCKGHFNIFGITKMPEKLLDILRYAGKEQVQELMFDVMAEAEQNDWPFSINHPFLHIWKWLCDDLELSRLHFIEIVNDPTYQYAHAANDETLRSLDYLWNQGYVIYGLGGSDSHNLIDEYYEGATEPSIAGDPGTYVKMDGMSQEHLLSAIKQGHVYVSRYITLDVTIRQGARDYLPGDELPVSETESSNITYEVLIANCEEEPLLYCVRNGRKQQLILQKQENGTWKGVLSFSWEDEEWEWLRMEIRRKDGSFLAYVNPVYHGRKQPKVRTYGEAVREWRSEACD